MPDRDETGRFKPGHKLGGPGRPPRSKEEKYLKALTDALTMKKWREIVQQAITDAIKGDFRARQWLSDYAIGKPVQLIELSAPDQALLADLLALAEQRGHEASAIFNSLIAAYASLPVESDDDTHDSD